MYLGWYRIIITVRAKGWATEEVGFNSGWG
jgi:hypothetical protein